MPYKELRKIRLPEVKVIQVIETKTIIGSGTENDPTRQANAYWTLDGVLLAFRDSDLNDSL